VLAADRPRGAMIGGGSTSGNISLRLTVMDSGLVISNDLKFAEHQIDDWTRAGQWRPTARPMKPFPEIG